MINTHKAKKSLGQHFLTSEGAVGKIILAGAVDKGDTVLEIGPGRGVLTRALLHTGAHVIAVEKDDSLIPTLSHMFKNEIASAQLKLIHDDILEFNTMSLPLTYKLVANIPYYITGEIIRLFLTAQHKPHSIVILVQKEVAERIVAKDGKESILSLSVKYFGTPTYIQTVKRGSFNPPPQVDSAIIRIEIRKKKKEIGNREEVKFFEMIKTGFKSKRKKLISNLSPLYAKDTLSRAFAHLGLDENTRAEDLTLSEWLDLQTALTQTS